MIVEVARLKEFLLENDKVIDVLEDLGCHHISNKGNYITCGNPDGGDNKSAITVYTDSENLTVVDYTRTLVESKRTTDILDLVAYFKGFNFIETMKYLCDFCGLDYYAPEQELPESLQILKLLSAMQKEDSDEEDDAPLQPISEKILDYYLPLPNIMFEDDGVSCKTQMLFKLGYDTLSNSVTIPIYDEIGSLVGVKARRFKYTESTPKEKRRFNEVLDASESKYFYIEPCNKSAVLYGLYQNINMIQQTGVCYIFESERAVMQAYDMGYYGVATGGTKVSKRQIDMLIRLGVKLVFAFDEDFKEEDLKSLADQFINGIDIYAMVDNEGLLDAKQSPTDDKNKWYKMLNKIKRIK